MLLKEAKVPTKFNLLRAVMAWRLPLRWYQRLTLATAGAIWLLIVLGGLVRVTGSGQGCGASWPMCHGQLIPNLEYHELIEWNHRLIAFLVGWLMVITVGTTLLWYRQPRRLMWMAILAAVTYIGQAILGGITVLLHLDHTWVAAHMGNSMLLLASVVLLALFSRVSVSSSRFQVSGLDGETQNSKFTHRATLRAEIQNSERWLRGVVLGALLWTYVGLFTGSAVIGADANLACSAWPQCGENQLLPETAAQWINFGHRLAVGLSDVLLLVVAVMIWRSNRRQDRRLMNTTRILAGIYISQVFVGAFTIWLGAPPFMKGAHLALAAATWATLVVMTAFVWIGPAKSSRFQVPGSKLDSGSGSDGGDSGKELEVEVEKPEVQRPKVGVLNASSVTNNLKLKTQNSKLGIYLGLMRLKVIPLLLIPTLCAMLIAAVQHPVQGTLLPLIGWTLLGGTLATGGAHAINQYLDRDIDARMRRTRRRAVASGQLAPENALIFGIALTIVGVLQLALTVNWLAAGLALAGNLFYVFVYTIWLKRTSTQNIVIGGAAGAVPPLVGWAAVTGRLDLPALLFFAIIFFWTPAHFWALALVRKEDYEAAGVPMLPVVRGEKVTRWNILLYAVLLVAVTILPFAVNALSWLYLVTAVGLGTLLVSRAVGLLRKGTAIRAWRLFKFSNTYLAVLYLVMVIDRVVALGWISF